MAMPNPPMPNWMQAPSGMRSAMRSAILLSSSLGVESGITQSSSVLSMAQVTSSMFIMLSLP